MFVCAWEVVNLPVLKWSKVNMSNPCWTQLQLAGEDQSLLLFTDIVDCTQQLCL